MIGTVVSILFVAPVLWSSSVPFSPGPDCRPGGGQSFTDLSLDNYAGLINNIGAGSYIWNSLTIALGSAVLSLVITTLAAYALVNTRSGIERGVRAHPADHDGPFQAILTPLFLEMNALGLTDSLAGIIVFHLTFNLPFGVS